MYRVPSNNAYNEYVVLPFYNGRCDNSYTVSIAESHNIQVANEQFWCWYSVQWTNASQEENNFTLKIDCNIDTSLYDEIVLNCAQAMGTHIRVELVFIDGTTVSSNVLHIASYHPTEFVISIKNYPHAQLSSILVHVETSGVMQGVLVLNWVIGRSSHSIPAEIFFLKNKDSWVLSKEQRGAIRFYKGLVFSEHDLEALRKKKNTPLWSKHFQLLQDEADRFLQRDPQKDFADYLPIGDVRYIRAADINKTSYHWEALVLAFVGIVNEDDRYINHAVDYLLCMIHTQHWCDNLIYRSPDELWNWRSFQEELTTTSVALLVDWLFFALKPQTVDLALNSLWHKGMSKIRGDLLKYDYMHHMNQGVVFNRGFILAGLLLEETWQKMAPTVDAAYDEMITTAQEYLKKDGSFPEGIGYFCQFSSGLIWAVIAYARARSKNWQEHLSQIFQKAPQYIAKHVYNAEKGSFQPLADCRVDTLCGDVVPILASLFPTSIFSQCLQSTLDEGAVYHLTGTLACSGGMVGMVYGPTGFLPQHNAAPRHKKFFFPDAGEVHWQTVHTSLAIKAFFIVGGGLRSHAHLDVGNFLLAINEQPVLIDRGMVNYWKPTTMLLKQTFMHNCLTPVNNGMFTSQSDCSSCPCPSPQLGEAKCVKADITHLFGDIFETYFRKISFDNVSTFLIVDTVHSSKPATVALHFHSYKKPSISQNTILLRYETFAVEISCEYPCSITWSCDTNSFAEMDTYHIVIKVCDITKSILTTKICIHNNEQSETNAPSQYNDIKSFFSSIINKLFTY